MFGTINSNASDKPELDRLKKFRNKESLKEATDFLRNNNDEAAETLAREYKDRDGKTLGKKYEEAHEKNEEFPKVAYLLVLPILYKMYLQYKENEADAALNSKKDEYEAFLKSVVEKGKNDPAQIKEELEVYSKEKLREMSKKIIEKQSALFDEKMGTMDINQIEKVMNNLQTQISSNKGIDMKALATCLSEPVQNTQVAGPAKPNAALIAANQAQTSKWKTMNPNNAVANYDKELEKIFKGKTEGNTVDISSLKLTGLQDGDFVKLCPNSGCNKYVQITSRERNEAVLVGH